jgi:hypothetical protein
MNFSDWMPARIAWPRSAGGSVQPSVEWTLMRRQRLLDPFFEETLQRQMMHPFHQVFRRDSSMEEMVEWTEAHPGAPLGGIIFHMSRCGSTLLCRQLMALERNIVASEPAPVDGVLRASMHIPGLPHEVQVRWLRAMVAAIGQPRNGEQAFYLKTDCWHVRHADLLREAFPNIPRIFLYRDPVEVMVSQRRMPAVWTVPGMVHPHALGMEFSDWDPRETDVYCARALANICEAGLRAAQSDPRCLLVNYSELPEAICGRLLGHFGLREEHVPAMRAAAQQSAKVPSMTFERDSNAKQAEATERLRTVVAEHLQPVYERLEAVRMAQMESPVAVSA